jgi:hypothetical protein
MTRKLLLALAVAGTAAIAACDSSPTDATRPQYDVHTRRTTTTATAPGDTTARTQSGEPGIGEPCDPATYAGPYRCILKDPNNDQSGYVVAY